MKAERRVSNRQSGIKTAKHVRKIFSRTSDEGYSVGYREIEGEDEGVFVGSFEGNEVGSKLRLGCIEGCSVGSIDGKLDSKDEIEGNSVGIYEI